MRSSSTTFLSISTNITMLVFCHYLLIECIKGNSIWIICNVGICCGVSIASSCAAFRVVLIGRIGSIRLGCLAVLVTKRLIILWAGLFGLVMVRSTTAARTACLTAIWDLHEFHQWVQFSKIPQWLPCQKTKSKTVFVFWNSWDH